MRKSASLLFLLSIILASCAATFRLDLVCAWEGSVVIGADGSVSPLDAPLQRTGDTYTLTNDINSNNYAITIQKNDITFDGSDHLILGASPNSGLKLDNIQNANVKNLNIASFLNGIEIFNSSNILISENRIENNEVGLIFLGNSNNFVSITNNTITQNQEGIAAFGAALNCTIHNNHIISNTQNALTIGYEGCNWTNTLITGNYIANNNGTGILATSKNCLCANSTITGNSINNNVKGVTFAFSCQDNLISGNNIIGNQEAGISLIEAPLNNKISGNRIENNGAGILLSSTSTDQAICSRNEIVGNNINTNRDCGIGLIGASNNSIHKNTIVNNIQGILLQYLDAQGFGVKYSETNLIYSNNINDNYCAIQIFNSTNNYFLSNNIQNNSKPTNTQYSTNLWDNGAQGNYWSSYQGEDTNGDGIGDTPYLIDNQNQDNYPLTNPTTQTIPTPTLPPSPSPTPVSPPTTPTTPVTPTPSNSSTSSSSPPLSPSLSPTPTDSPSTAATISPKPTYSPYQNHDSNSPYFYAIAAATAILVVAMAILVGIRQKNAAAA